MRRRIDKRRGVVVGDTRARPPVVNGQARAQPTMVISTSSPRRHPLTGAGALRLDRRVDAGVPRRRDALARGRAPPAVVGLRLGEPAKIGHLHGPQDQVTADCGSTLSPAGGSWRSTGALSGKSEGLNLADVEIASWSRVRARASEEPTVFGTRIVARGVVLAVASGSAWRSPSDGPGRGSGSAGRARTAAPPRAPRPPAASTSRSHHGRSGALAERGSKARIGGTARLHGRPRSHASAGRPNQLRRRARASHSTRCRSPGAKPGAMLVDGSVHASRRILQLEVDVKLRRCPGSRLRPRIVHGGSPPRPAGRTRAVSCPVGQDRQPDRDGLVRCGPLRSRCARRGCRPRAVRPSPQVRAAA